VRWLRPSSEDEMVALFLRTELTSVRHSPRIRELLDHEQLSERLLVAPDLTSPRENGVRRHLLSAHRGYQARVGLFNGFPDDVRWDWVALEPAELLQVKYINYDYWTELSGGSRLAADAPALILAGVAPFGVSGEWAIGFGEALAVAGASVPPLILVTSGRSDDLVVLEGHARLTAYAMRPEALPPELEVLLGSSPGMRAWGLY
jgi:hypothetical protein